MKAKFLVLAVGALWLGVGVAAQGAVPDHYKCYKAKETKNKCLGNPTVACSAKKLCEDQGTTGPCLGFPKLVTATLTNDFGIEQVDVKKPWSICPPVDKNGEGILDPAAHMKRYQIKVQKDQPKHVKQTVVMRDQYGDHLLQTIKEDSLLVPTAKSMLGPVEELTSDDHDHYKCYKVKELKKKCSGDLGVTKCKVDADCTAVGGFCELGFPKDITATLVDQFETKLQVVKKPMLICLPTDKNGEGINNPTDNLVGYQILTPKGGPKHGKVLNIYTNNQYGPELLSTIKEEFLLVPALKNPPPSGCSCSGKTTLGFTTGIPVGQPPAGTLSNYRCSNYGSGACAGDGDCDFGTCYITPPFCSGNTSISCTSDAQCQGTCAEVPPAGNLPLDLEVGALYTGGGLNSVPLPLPVPDQGLAYTNVTSYNGGTGVLTLGPTAPGDVGQRHCTKGRTGTCPGPSCVDNCLYGPPLPIPNSGTPATSVCTINVVAEDAAGTAQCDGGDSDLNIALRSVIYLNGDLFKASTPPDIPGVQPCPLCDTLCVGGSKDKFPCNGDGDCPGGSCSTSTTCLGGPNDGAACTPETSDSTALNDPENSYPTSQDCGNDPLADITANIGGLPIALNMTTGSQTLNAEDRPNGARVFCGFCRDVAGTGSLCFEGNTSGSCPAAIPAADGNGVPCSSDADCADGDEYESCVQRNAGAFSEASSTRISVTGDSSGCLGDGNPHAGTLVSIFCIPPTFDATVDAAGDLPGPGSVLLYGDAQLQ